MDAQTTLITILIIALIFSIPLLLVYYKRIETLENILEAQEKELLTYIKKIEYQKEIIDKLAQDS